MAEQQTAETLQARAEIRNILFGLRADLDRKMVADGWKKRVLRAIEFAIGATNGLTAHEEEIARLTQETTELRRKRIGDSEIIGREMCRAEKAEADLAALRQQRETERREAFEAGARCEWSLLWKRYQFDRGVRDGWPGTVDDAYQQYLHSRGAQP